MRRFFLGIFVFLTSTFCAFSAGADWVFGIGMGIPNYNYSIEDWGDVDLNAIDMDFTLSRVAKKSGITLKFSVDMGIGWSDELQERTSIGFDFRSDVGLGWTPIRTERFWFTGTGLIGFGGTLFSYKTSYTYPASGNWGVKEETVTEQWSFLEVFAGLEGTAVLRLGDTGGLYFTIGYRKLLVGQYGDRIDGETKSGYYYGWKDGSYANLEKSGLSGALMPYITFGYTMFL